MRATMRSITAVGLLAILLAVGIAGRALAQRANESVSVLTRGCTNQTLSGVYGFQRTGQTGQGSLTAVGIATFDGQGNTVAQQTISRSGTFNVVTDQIGTYSINPDCSGTLYGPTGAVSGRLVVVHNGRGVMGMSLTPGNSVASNYERITD